jgi:putative ABC transport system permease protein
MSWLSADCVIAIRRLKREPVVIGVAVLTLSIGVGVNLSVLSVVDALLFRRLPYANPHELVRMVNVTPNSSPGGHTPAVRFTELPEWRSRIQLFAGLEGFLRVKQLRDDLDARPTDVTMVAAGMFALLGVQPALGRALTEADSSQHVTVISDALWRSEFNANPNILTRSIRLEGRPHAIVGVMPPGFVFPNPSCHIWVPLVPREYVFALGRLRAGLSVADARLLARAIGAQLDQQLPLRDGWSTDLLALDGNRVSVKARETTTALSAAALLVLVIATINLTTLLRYRLDSRSRELHIRAALGAGRGAFASTILIEGAFIAGASLLGGLVIGLWTSEAIRTHIGLDQRIFEPRVQVIAALWVVAAAGLASFAAGRRWLVTPPATRTADLVGGLASGAKGRLRAYVLGVQVTGAFVLLWAALSLVQSVVHSRRVEPGFRPDDLTFVAIRLRGEAYPTPASRYAVYDAIEDSIRNMPAVGRVTSGDAVPPELSAVSPIECDGLPAAADATFVPVSAAYFETLGIELTSGRSFLPSEQKMDAKVAVVDERTTSKCWRDGSPLGKRIAIGFHREPFTVIGVARSVAVARSQAWEEDPRPQIYVPSGAGRVGLTRVFAVRTKAGVTGVPASLRQTLMDQHAGVAVTRVSSAAEQLRDVSATMSKVAALVGGLGVAAWILCASGTCGLVLCYVRSRHREIAIRLALGAQSPTVFRLIFRQVSAPVLAGLVLGLSLSLWCQQTLGALLFGVRGDDITTLSLVSLFLLATSAIITLVPVIGIARIQRTGRWGERFSSTLAQ